MQLLQRIFVLVSFAVLAGYPFFATALSESLPIFDHTLGRQLIAVFCYGILALSLNVVVGYTGLLHLGIAAFFGIGAYVTGILSVQMFPFQTSFVIALFASVSIAALVGVIATAPTLRLRGDYLALVTLGFGMIAVYGIRNLDEITDGTRGLNPVTPTLMPGLPDPDLTIPDTDNPERRIPIYDDAWGKTWRQYPYFYWICLGFLGLVMLLLRNLERSRLGRSWIALREDELASTCMGLNPARLKLAAIALGAGIAGLAGCLYAISQNTTAGPSAYDFNRSMITLCCLILGGLGNRAGVLLGVFILVGYDTILTQIVDNYIQRNIGDWIANAPGGLKEWLQEKRGSNFLKISGWRLSIFGLALILMMRFRPEGILPATHMKHELHPEEGEPKT
jgi:branched-chain amino acid transport system permease protein